MKYEAVVELEVALGPVDPTHREEYKIFEGLANAVNHAIVDEIPYHEALEGVALVKVRILKPGQGYIYNPSGLTGKTEEIVLPAAAGEEPQHFGEYTLLEGGAFAAAASMLELGAVIEWISFSSASGIVVVGLIHESGSETIVLPIEPGLVRRILNFGREI